MRSILFVDRDGTLVKEPEDYQVDRLDKIQLLPDVIASLQALQGAGYELVLVSNQDGLGTSSFPKRDFDLCHDFIIQLLSSQGITFAEQRICPHFDGDGCDCRKPQVGLIRDLLPELDRRKSAVVGDRSSDRLLADNIGVPSYILGDGTGWQDVVQSLLFSKGRHARITRKTHETDIQVTVNLDGPPKATIATGLRFFDHMLEQLAVHGGFSLEVLAKGDLDVDEHHTIEDTAIAIGRALHQALGARRGIGRYGFCLPMDESRCLVAIDLGGRAFFKFDGTFTRERVGAMPTEMVPHFFQSLATELKATLHLEVTGDNAHHMIEAMFKGFARALRSALKVERGSSVVPSTKGVL